MSLEVIKRSRIKIQDKGNNLYLVQVDLTNRENYANLYYIKDDEISGEYAYSGIESVEIENKDYGTIVINGNQFDCSFDGEEYGKELYNYMMDLLDSLKDN